MLSSAFTLIGGISFAILFLQLDLTLGQDQDDETPSSSPPSQGEEGEVASSSPPPQGGEEGDVIPGDGGGYDGYYDLSAKDTGYLCSLMDEYKKTGKQPDIVHSPAGDFPKEKYLREDQKCWRNRWFPCEDADLMKAKPCGWYQMEEAPDSEC